MAKLFQHPQAFEHYLLTCFNIDRGFDPENKRNSPEYLDSRFSIFESITVPSVKAQSCSNFSWLVFFDINTPENYRKRLETTIKSVNNFTPFYVKNYSDIKDILKKRLKSETEYLVTTNLDNDDAISDNFIEILQGKLIEEEVYLINFLMGYMISNKGLFMREYYSSPFHTLSEKVSNEIITCLDVPHNLLFTLQKQGLSLYQIVCEPTWLQIVHGSNVMNKIETNAIPIFNLECLKRFKINNLPFDLQNSFIYQTNRFNSAFSWFKKKRRKSLSFKLKLALYTLIPPISILYNKYKLRTSSKKEFVEHKYSLEEFRAYLSTLAHQR